MAETLVRELPAGSLDVIGDIHGEFDLLTALIARLGYDANGDHPHGRQLVFVGDLVDRGPDSIAVAHWVERLVRERRGYCVLGNHELNLLLRLRKHGNLWFHGEEESLADDGITTPARLADEDDRQQLLAFFASLPVALVRQDLRIVHASWSDWAVEQARAHTDVLMCYRSWRKQLIADLDLRGITESVDRELELQNRNPIKILTSGPERRTEKPFFSSGRHRQAERVPWWNDYDNGAIVAFGHYSNFHTQGFQASHGECLDYGAALRWSERRNEVDDDAFASGIGALRWPEQEVVVER